MCVVLRFAVFVARYLNYIEYRCCISDTLRSIQFYFIVEEGCTKLVSFRLFGSNGGRTGPFAGEQVAKCYLLVLLHFLSKCFSSYQCTQRRRFVFGSFRKFSQSGLLVALLSMRPGEKMYLIYRSKIFPQVIVSRSHVATNLL